MKFIAGIVHFTGPSLNEISVKPLLRRMNGDRAAGLHDWISPEASLGIGHSGNPAKSSSQPGPLISADGQLVLVFDGRIDNRSELLRLMAPFRISAGEKSDPELIMAAYRCWQGDCVRYLLGDFAFAIWDVRRKRLTCARDPTGARPFYYVCNSRYFAFASEEESLLLLPGISGLPRSELIAFYLVRDFQTVAPHQTWLQGVSSLLPARSLQVTPHGMGKPVQYWRFEPGPETRFDSDRDYSESFTEVFGEAVRARMGQSAEPAGMVSGGIDSAGMVAMSDRIISEMPGRRFHAYSVVADDIGSSLESRCILSLTNNEHMISHRLYVPLPPGSIDIEDLKQVAWSNAHPIANSILIPSMMCLAASRNGHFRLLHAACGDLAMGHYHGYLATILRSGRWLTAWRESLAASKNHTYLRFQTPLDLFLRSAWSAYMPATIRLWVRRMRSGAFQPPAAVKLLNPSFEKRLGVLGFLREQSDRSVRQTASYSRQTHAEQVFGPWGLGADLAAGQLAASRYGVELRDPWADRRVLEFMLHLPLNQLVRDGWTKYIARSALASLLEESVVWRSDKEHLGWMLVTQLMKESGEVIEKSMSTDLELIEDYVDVDAVRELYSQYLISRNDANTEPLYAILTLVHWIKRLSKFSNMSS